MCHRERAQHLPRADQRVELGVGAPHQALRPHLAEDARAILERVPWQARDVNGRFNTASVLDIQDWFVKEGFLKTKAPIERLISTEYSDHIEKTLGPFEVENKASQMKGCR